MYVTNHPFGVGSALTKPNYEPTYNKHVLIYMYMYFDPGQTHTHTPSLPSHWTKPVRVDHWRTNKEIALSREHAYLPTRPTHSPSWSSYGSDAYPWCTLDKQHCNEHAWFRISFLKSPYIHAKTPWKTRWQTLLDFLPRGVAAADATLT